LSSTVGAGSDDDEGGVWMASSEEDEEGMCSSFSSSTSEEGSSSSSEESGFCSSSTEEEGGFSSEEEGSTFSSGSFNGKVCFLLSTRTFLRDKQLGIVFLVGDWVCIASSSEEEGSFSPSPCPFGEACFLFSTRIFFRGKQVGIVDLLVDFDEVGDWIWVISSCFLASVFIGDDVGFSSIPSDDDDAEAGACFLFLFGVFGKAFLSSEPRKRNLERTVDFDEVWAIVLRREFWWSRKVVEGGSRVRVVAIVDWTK
jgi:hypothetical protein